MPKKKFTFGPDDPRTLVVSWFGYWSNLEVQLDGAPLGTIPSRAALKAGHRLPLPDGSLLEVKLSGWPPALAVSRDGVPLIGSRDDPQTQVKNARNAALAIGGLNLGGWLVLQLVEIAFLTRLGFSWITAAAGVLMLGLGYLIGRRSTLALATAVTLVAADTVLLLYMVADTGARVPAGGLAMRALFVAMMVPGFAGIRRVEDADRARARLADVF